jgi:hypothetical protein
MLTLVFLFFQTQMDPVRALDEIRLKQGAEVERFDRERQVVIRLQRREFEERLNDLIRAIGQFSIEYNESKGEVWPKKKAEAIAKAMRRLESSYAWKRGLKGKMEAKSESNE